MIYLNPNKWKDELSLPGLSDPRWGIAALLTIYVVLGCTVLGFSRSPLQIILGVSFGIILDFLLSGSIRGKKIFPLSAYITCLSLSILLNYSLGYNFLWMPVFIAIASKYVITINGKHIFNPSLFAICVSLWISNELISLAPTYQWYGSVQTFWAMLIFITTGALFLFIFKINRSWLIFSFLFFYALQTALRAYILRYHIPAETLFVGTLTSPAFYLFTFYMITDPKTSPSTTRGQILGGFFIAFFDLYYHTHFSLFTFFYAGLTFALIRSMIGLFKERVDLRTSIIQWAPKALLITVFAIPVLIAFKLGLPKTNLIDVSGFSLQAIPSSHSGIDSENGNVIEQTDPKIQHVAKWLLSVGDSVATADVDLDGKQDVFLTQTLKSDEWRAKLYLNKGGFKFEKVAIPQLEKYILNFKENGLPTYSLFLDYDNDGDKDLFVGFSFGKSRFFENKLIPEKDLIFEEVLVPFLNGTRTNSIAANGLDFNKDGYLDLLVANVIPAYLKDYKEKVPFTIFDLPEPVHEGDRRMFHYMHHSWHNANNGEENYLLINEQGENFRFIDKKESGLKETRWSLSVGTGDYNEDGWTDIYIANDFGHDECYLNIGGKYFEKKEGSFFNDLGLDTYKGMNASVGDLDGNLKEDIYVSNVHHHIQAEGSLLWMNYSENKNLDFKERASQFGALNPNRFGWGAAIADFNLDGWLDIAQANGMVSDKWDKKYDKAVDYWYLFEKVARSTPSIHSYADKWPDIRGAYIFPDEPDRIYLNYKGKQFEDVAGKVGFNHRANTRGIAPVDFDDDGDLDLLITDQFGTPKIYRNEVKNRKWVGFNLIGNGTSTNRDAVGSKVWLKYRIDGVEKKQFREVHLANGLASQSDMRLVFGLDSQEHLIENVTLVIRWHDGEVAEVNDIDINQYHEIHQGNIVIGKMQDDKVN